MCAGCGFIQLFYPEVDLVSEEQVLLCVGAAGNSRRLVAIQKKRADSRHESLAKPSLCTALHSSRVEVPQLEKHEQASIKVWLEKYVSQSSSLCVCVCLCVCACVCV